MLKHKTPIITMLCLILIIFCSCSDPHASYVTQIYALDTVIDLTAYGENAQQAINAATEEIYRLEKLLSVTNENSDIYKLNNASGKELTLNPDTCRIIELAKNSSAQTQGKFDPTIYPVLKLWGFTEDEYSVPAKEEITAALKSVDYKNIELGIDQTVSLKNRAQIDLGGIAKGHIADKAADAMKDAGCTSGLISLGGNVRTIGKKPDGTLWSIGIKDPDGGSYFATITLQDDHSIITSGAYQRNFTVAGKTYHHIIDPKTGNPSESDAVSVTIIGKDGAWCDALSTAIYIGGTEFAETLCKESNDFEYIILTKDHRLYVSGSLKDSFSLSKDFVHLEIIYK